ncbi:uncharacterized protein LOC142907956 [Petromyzon marinus]|uniref:uncharacterized protein LOC142907956 n=1 Tax=Petromyzon marinus TaxID=7757 RepID=UPI003F724812
MTRIPLLKPVEPGDEVPGDEVPGDEVPGDEVPGDEETGGEEPGEEPASLDGGERRGWWSEAVEDEEEEEGGEPGGGESGDPHGPAHRPAHRPDHRPAHRPAHRPDHRPAQRPVAAAVPFPQLTSLDLSDNRICDYEHLLGLLLLPSLREVRLCGNAVRPPTAPCRADGGGDGDGAAGALKQLRLTWGADIGDAPLRRLTVPRRSHRLVTSHVPQVPRMPPGAEDAGSEPVPGCTAAARRPIMPCGRRGS